MQTLLIFWSSWRLKMIVSERQQIFTWNLLVRIAIILYYLNFYISVTSFWSICSFGFHGVQEHTIEQITTRYWGIYVIHTYMSWTFSWLLTPLAVWVSPSYLCCVQIVRRYFILFWIQLFDCALHDWYVYVCRRYKKLVHLKNEKTYIVQVPRLLLQFQLMKLILTISMVVEVELPVAIWVCLAAGHIQPHLHMPWCHSLGIKKWHSL